MSGVMRAYGVAVCADCLQYYTHQEGTSRQHASAYAKGKASYSNNPNELVCMYIDVDLYTEHSKNPCEICSSPLHGKRYFGSIKIVL
jgi:ribosome-binding protein aMBF1 (putative translation factor)